MFCKKCGKKQEDSQKFCTGCGFQFSQVDKNEEEAPEIKPFETTLHNKRSWGVRRIISILIVLVIIVIAVYNNLDEDSITKNNDGLSSFDSGDTQTAINQFQQATREAVTNETKVNTLKNLGYAYISEGQTEQALNAFKEALGLAKTNTSDYYLISGEIASLETKPNSAILSFNKAYELNPNDFQINNSLAIFYLDLEETAPQYSDYPKALSHALKAYEYDTEKSEIVKQNLAIAHFFNDNFDQTISLLSTTNLIQHPYAAFWLGLAYANKEDHVNAKINLQKAIDGGVELPQEIQDYLISN